MELLLVALLVAGALCAPTPQLSDISTQDGNTRLVPLFVRDPQVSPNTLIPVVVPAPAENQQKIDEAVQVVEGQVSQVVSGLSDIGQAIKTEENIEAAIEEEISEAVAVEDTVAAAVEEVLNSGAPEAFVQTELAEAIEVQAEVDQTVGEDVQLAAQAEEAALARITEDIADIAAAADAEVTVNEETDSSNGEPHTPLPDAMSNVMAMVVQAAAEIAKEENVAAPEAQEDSGVVEQAAETAVLASEQIGSTAVTEPGVAALVITQEAILEEPGAQTSEQSSNVDVPENSATHAGIVEEVIAVEEEPSEIQEAVSFEASAIGNAEKDASTVTQVIEVIEEGPAKNVLSLTPDEEVQISTVDESIAEAEAVVAQAEEILSGAVDVTAPEQASEKVPVEVPSQTLGKSLSSAAEATTADSGSETAAEITAVEGVVTIDEATRSAIEAALSNTAPDAAAIVIFPQVTAEGGAQPDEGLLFEEGVTSQTEAPVFTEADASESENTRSTVATFPVEATTDAVIVIDEASATPQASEAIQVPESSASQTAEVVSPQAALETNRQLPKQRPTPAQGNLLVNPATKSAFFSTSSFGSPISAANIILGQPVRVPGAFGASGALTPQLQGPSNVQARNLVDPQFRQFIFDNDSPDVVAAKINFFRVRSATLGAPIAISVGATPGSSSTAAPSPVDAAQSAPSPVDAPESAPLPVDAPQSALSPVDTPQSAPSEAGGDARTSAASEAAPPTAAEAAESSTALLPEAA